MNDRQATVRNPFFARWIFPHVIARHDARGGSEHRRELLAGLSGRVIEVGAGNGSNFEHYPRSVDDLVATEPESHLRFLAARAAESASIPVRVVDGVAENLPAEDASFDAGIASLVLCSVADPPRALAELFRVIRSGGQLRFYEHVRASNASLALIQRVVDATVWPRLGGGCHTSRDTRAAIEQAGFVIERCREFMFRPCVVLFPAAPHILGVARRP
jgi:ubiquinone/menaquinone biosynthesis C-methylase UbiE